ncbi:MAG TPA: alpha/beta hydrolase-fold protein [Candidatus Acidoferrales bacterium]|jgi:predicted alpha/beta superfamily hydrolase|nr:alpha/beta hydrolase-fold protein [Candidatus Acidoferrales bacterium]
MRHAKEEGRIRLLPRFASRYLSTSRELVVYVPPGYDSSPDRYPVLYLQDGQNLFDPATAFAGQDWRADVTADDLILWRVIEPIIIVGLYNTGVRRISEYTPTRDPRHGKGGKGDRYAMMLAREVKPFIDSEFRTRRSAAHTGVGGSSLGGLVSLEVGLLYPRVFGKLALLSPSVWWDQQAILKMIEGCRLKARPRIWLDAGTAEGDAPEHVIADLRRLRGSLVEKGWREGADLRYWEVPGAGHHESAWAARFGPVLQYLFPAVF